MAHLFERVHIPGIGPGAITVRDGWDTLCGVIAPDGDDNSHIEVLAPLHVGVEAVVAALMGFLDNPAAASTKAPEGIDISLLGRFAQPGPI